MNKIDWARLAEAGVYGTFTSKCRHGQTEQYVNGQKVASCEKGH